MNRPAAWWKRLAPFLVAGFVVLGVFRLFVRPDLQEELTRAEERAAALAAHPAPAGGELSSATDGSAAEEVRTDLAGTEARVAALTGILARPEETESVLHSLGVIASAAGVQFRRFAPEPEVRLDGYRARAASVVAGGAFFDLLRFLERLSQLSQLVLIEDFQIESGPDGLLECRFVAVTLAAPEPISETNPNAPPAAPPNEGE